MGLTAPFKSRQKLKDFVSWFEIPVYDIHRAARFYNAIYNMEMQIDVNGEFAMAFFPADKGIGGALVAGPGCTPNATGVLIYLNAGTDMDSVLGRVELAGGRIIMSRTTINENAGAFALFIDSEGNRLALHEGARSAEASAAARAQTTAAAPKAARATTKAAKATKPTTPAKVTKPRPAKATPAKKTTKATRRR